MIAERDKIIVLQALHIVAFVDAWKVKIHVFHIVCIFTTHHERQVFSLAQHVIAVASGEAKVEALESFLGCFIGFDNT